MILLASTNIEHSFFFILCAPFICVSRNIRSGGQGVLSPHWSQGGHLSERNSEAPQSVGYILCLLAVMRSLLLGRKELAEKESRPDVILHRLETADEDLRSYNHADFRKVLELRSVRMSVCRLRIFRLVVCKDSLMVDPPLPCPAYHPAPLLFFRSRAMIFVLSWSLPRLRMS